MAAGWESLRMHPLAPTLRAWMTLLSASHEVKKTTVRQRGGGHPLVRFDRWRLRHQQGSTKPLGRCGVRTLKAGRIDPSGI
jgi:hypothetical protein